MNILVTRLHPRQIISDEFGPFSFDTKAQKEIVISGVARTCSTLKTKAIPVLERILIVVLLLAGIAAFFFRAILLGGG